MTKRAYEMRISDWSSDVCSSDLRVRLARDGVARSAIQAVERRLALGDELRGPFERLAVMGGEQSEAQRLAFVPLLQQLGHRHYVAEALRHLLRSGHREKAVVKPETGERHAVMRAADRKSTRRKSSH